MAEKIDILLINPGDHKNVYQKLGDEFAAIEPPAFAGLFATYLRKKGVSVAILDVPALRVSAEKAVEDALSVFDPVLSVVVVYGHQPSASSQNMVAAGKIARALKEGSATKVMMTGTHPAALPERTMREEKVDFVCDLEGPVTILETFRALKASLSDFSNVASLWWRRGDLIMPPRASAALVKDLDIEMPGISWDLLDMSRYRAHNWHSFEHINERSPYASIHTTLGCPYKCNFCCINAPFGKPSYRMWDPESVVREIDFLVETYGIKNIKFVDEMFVLNRRHVMGICDLLIKRDYKVNIWAYARVDTVEDDMLDKLKAAGVNWLCLGIESASEHVRDGASKKFGDDEIKGVIRRIQEAGIYIIGNYIFGLPDDTLDRMQATLDLALDVNCEFANFYSAMAYPGSQLYRHAVEKGYELPDTWNGFSQHAYDTKPLANEHLTAAQILEFRDNAFIKYFNHKPYLDMVGKKFGNEVVEHLGRMSSIPVKRKILGQ